MKNKHEAESRASVSTKIGIYESEPGEDDSDHSINTSKEMDHQNTKSDMHESESSEKDSSQTSINTSEEVDDQKDDKAWDMILIESLPQLKYNNVQNLWKDEHLLQEVLKAIRKETKRVLDLAEAIESSNLYQAISDEQQRLEDNEYGEDEAEKMAWQNRRYLVIKLLKDRHHVLNLFEE